MTRIGASALSSNKFEDKLYGVPQVTDAPALLYNKALLQKAGVERAGDLGRAQDRRRLILPLARPGIAVTAFYTFLTAWGEVAYASKFMTSEDKYTLAFGMQTYVGQFKTEWGDLAAASILVTIPALAVFYVVQKYLVSGLTAGGTKG